MGPPGPAHGLPACGPNAGVAAGLPSLPECRPFSVPSARPAWEKTFRMIAPRAISRIATWAHWSFGNRPNPAINTLVARASAVRSPAMALSPRRAFPRPRFPSCRPLGTGLELLPAPQALSHAAPPGRCWRLSPVDGDAAAAIKSGGAPNRSGTMATTGRPHHQLPVSPAGSAAGSPVSVPNPARSR